MARQTIIRLKDDLDGSDATLTVAFSWDGVAYEIDLSKKNAAAFATAVAPYAESARRVTTTRTQTRTRTRTAGRPARSASKPDLAAVRDWAGKNGYAVAARGRISGTVTAAFAAAQATPTTTSTTTSTTASTVPAATPAATPRKSPAPKRPVKKAAPRKAAAKKAVPRKAAAKKA